MASEEFLLSRCQLQLRNIEIDPDYCRDKINTTINHLNEVFEDPNTFNPHVDSNQFPVLISQEELRQLLEDSRVSYSSFIESQSRTLYHRLTSSYHKLRYVYRRQRYEAAIRSAKLGPDTW